MFAQLPAECAIAAITWSELYAGVLRAVTSRQRIASQEFLSEAERWLPVIPFGRLEAEERARLYEHLRAGGRIIGERDLQIAATAVAGGHSVATRNSGEFSRVPGLVVISLPEPSA